MKHLYKIVFVLAFLIAAFPANSQSDQTATPSCTAPTQELEIICNGAFYDFNNAGQTTFSYTYTIDGGTPVSGTFDAPSSFTIPGMSPGQTSTFTLTWVGICEPNTLTNTCTVPCPTTATPNFATIAPFCSGSTAPVLSNTSPNGIAGTWSPAAVSNTASGTYVFTPTSLCASPQTLTVTVLPKVTPTFNSVAPICQNSSLTLPTSSTNTPPITGTWSPSVSTTALGTRTYTFTPTTGQCVSATPTTMSVTVIPNVTPNFAPIAPFCAGTNAPSLATVSPNGISGTWSPAIINNTTSGSYTFTPVASQCASTQTLTTSVTPSPTPVFSTPPPFCAGSMAPTLPLVSNDGISGTWSPATVSNTASGLYTFTPNAGQCASTKTLFITVKIPRIPNFPSIAFCEGDNPPSLNEISPNGVRGTWAPAIIDPVIEGSYIFSPNEGECATSQTITTSINQPTLTAIDYTVTEAFSDDAIITVMATSAGNYLYQLDGGELQQSNIFTNVAEGTHTVMVIDVNGCSDPLVQENIKVIKFPHYFTPNADGYHDAWKINGLSNDAIIMIFDRYGKLLKQIQSDGPGWDGTYNNAQMPSSDYWFTVQYNNQSQAKRFLAHFTLKR